jgi:DNA polymerase-4
MAALCRECLAESAQEATACAACGASRLITHSELHSLSIAHIDCDAFFASVEKRDDPSLEDKPLIVGGGKRGVVSTCCYVARRYGVRSAMPMFKALKLCPHAVVLPPDIAKYSKVGQQIRSMMNDLTPLVQSVSIDEAFLDLNGTEAVHNASPAITLARFAQRVRREVGVTVSVGLSYNRFLAKMASNLDKPSGFAVIGKAGVEDFLAPRSVALLPGVGAVFQERLQKDGVRLIGDLQRLDASELMRRYGEEGLRLSRLAHGIDPRPVVTESESKSVSAETTFEQDLHDAELLHQKILQLSEKVARRLRKEGIAGSVVTLKLKTPDFKLITRSRGLPAPTQLGNKIALVARDLFDKEPKGKAYRLIGVGLSTLCGAEQADLGDLVDTKAPQQARLEKTLDGLRARFGAGAINRAALIARTRKG